MSFSAGVFSINSTGQPVVTGTVISSTVFNALTTDLATGLSTCVLKDGTQILTANIPMGGFKLTGLGAGSASGNSLRYEQVNGLVTTKGDILVASAAGTLARLAAPSDGFAFIGDSAATNGVSTAALPISTCEFRLTLTTAVPVTTGDVTGAGTVFCTPYKGNRIALFDGTSTWNIRSSAEFSLALTLTSGKPYDVFCFDNAGVPTLETLVWTNDTARATALTTQNGVLVKTGATTRRYLGTLYSSGSNTTEDSLLKRYLWNYYNRVKKPMRAVDASDSWTYSTAAFRQANNSAANQLDYVQGVSEDIIFAHAIHDYGPPDGTARLAFTGIGVDSTTVNSASLTSIQSATNSFSHIQCQAVYRGYPGVGRHILPWLEYGTGTATTNWFGDNGGSALGQTGIVGEVFS